MCYVLDEVWKDLDGFEGLYKINNKGDIVSLYQEKSNGKRASKPGEVRKHTARTKNPMVMVNLRDNNGHVTERSLHYIAAENFIPNPRGYRKVKFKNGNVYDWNPSNLEWVEQ